MPKGTKAAVTDTTAVTVTVTVKVTKSLDPKEIQLLFCQFSFHEPLKCVMDTGLGPVRATHGKKEKKNEKKDFKFVVQILT